MGGIPGCNRKALDYGCMRVVAKSAEGTLSPLHPHKSKDQTMAPPSNWWIFSNRCHQCPSGKLDPCKGSIKLLDTFWTTSGRTRRHGSRKKQRAKKPLQHRFNPKPRQTNAPRNAVLEARDTSTSSCSCRVCAAARRSTSASKASVRGSRTCARLESRRLGFACHTSTGIITFFT